MKDIISLPPPQTDLDFPLMRAIKERRTKRKWQDAEVPMQDLSNLLWAACGITHEATKTGKSRRAAPSACNSQEIRVYVALKSGLFLYDETAHRLLKVLEDDIRKHMGTQKMMQNAPLGLVFVADYNKMTAPTFKSDEKRWYTTFVDTGFMSENIYLYCTAANLSTAVLGLIDREKLHGIMALEEHEKVVYTQVVGKPIACQP
jgi:SagB-type dehydrogenase family enzyme